MKRLLALLHLLSVGAAAAAPLAQLPAHDPSTILREGGRWWVFHTGRLLKHASSTDLRTWTPAGAVLAGPPDWAASVAPGNRNAHYWAPDALRIRNRILLYYSVSEFGKNTSAIALASSDRIGPGASWKDHGIVLQSGADDAYNAIDPSLLLDGDRLWMAFGSFWRGIFLVELDPATGLRRDAAREPIHLASSREIEAPTLHKRAGVYYLFINEGLCCRGAESTYRILVGRSQSVTGPYLDDQGRDLREGGGRLVIGTEGVRIGPGHAGIIADGEREWLSYHYYDKSRNGTPTLGLRPLEWTPDGWPCALPES